MNQLVSFSDPQTAPSTVLTLLDNRLDVPAHHLLQHDPQHATFQLGANNQLAPLSFLAQPPIDLLQVIGWLELNRQTSRLGLEV